MEFDVSVKPESPELIADILPDVEFEVELTSEAEIELDINVGSGDAPIYSGPYYIVPSNEVQPLATKNRLLRDNVTVDKIPYYEVSNAYGTTLIIGG